MFKERVAVITDSASDIEPEFAKEHGIDEIVPLSITFGPKGEEGSFLDRVTISSKEFFEKVRKSRFFPKTAAPSIEVFVQANIRAMEKKRTKNIFSIHIPPPPISATIENAKQAAEMLMKKNKHIRFEIVNSGQVSLGLGIPAIIAGELAQKGKKLTEIKEEIDKILPRLYTFALLDTLEFAKRGGRINLVKYLTATLLNFKPVIELHQGSLKTIAKIRTKSKAIDWFREHIHKLAENYGPFEMIAVEHGEAEKTAQLINDDLTNVALRNLGVFEIGPTLGSHGGPGTIGVSILLSSK